MTDSRFSSNQEIVINELIASGPCIASDLVRRTGCSHRAVYKALRYLHAAGYIAVAGTYNDGHGNDVRIWEVVQ